MKSPYETPPFAAATGSGGLVNGVHRTEMLILYFGEFGTGVMHMIILTTLPLAANGNAICPTASDEMQGPPGPRARVESAARLPDHVASAKFRVDVAGRFSTLSTV